MHALASDSPRSTDSTGNKAANPRFHAAAREIRRQGAYDWERPVTKGYLLTSLNTHPFDLLMELHTADIRLDCAALHLTRDVYPHVNVCAYLRQLDDLADEVAAERPGLSANLRYEAMRRVLVDRHELHGNEDDYYDPDNSFLNRVLERGLGVPISLSVVWMEVARRLKWPVTGLGLPGHFVIRFDDHERFVLVDPFYGGRTLRIDDCRRLLDHNYDGKVAFSSKFLLPVDTRTVLARMLNNLRNIYIANQDWPRVADTLARLAAVEPENDDHLHELAALLYHDGNVRGAYAHLSAYLRRRPHADDQLQVRQRLAHLDAVIASLN